MGWNAAQLPRQEGDYGRAYEVEGYVGQIDGGTSQALVLGDMPARTTFLPQFNVLVREIAGDDEAELPDLVAGLLPNVDWEPGPIWNVAEPVILFDSVYDSTEIENEEHLRIDLVMGEYVIEAGYIETPGEYLILVRLTLV
ncbi:Imm21 family immunity protein [Streptomyces sp. NPDC058391]|uniref:Imm21 family immunity protein n=1 Tax=Streptomyces sp. NPDC058391 TaxID=3346476 RepID=UPI00365267FC